MATPKPYKEIQMTEIKKQDLIPKIRGLIAERYQHAQTAAEAWGMTPPFLSKILNDPDYPIPNNLLEMIGYEKEKISKTVYRKSPANKG